MTKADSDYNMHGADYMRREIFRQELIKIKLKKEKGVDDQRPIEQWLTETVEYLDRVLK